MGDGGGGGWGGLEACGERWRRGKSSADLLEKVEDSVKHY